LDSYINGPNKPVAEHKKAGKNMSMMIHEIGFLAWHQYFLTKLEHWLVTNNNAKFVPLPYWDPANPIPSQLNKNNNNVNMPLPANLGQTALAQVTSYTELTNRILPYHAAVHNAAGGNMPDPEKSPGDPIFWPFHSFLLSIYEQWRNE
jgi:hypothetical protein